MTTVSQQNRNNYAGNKCMECGGTGICAHRRRKYSYKDCNGKGLRLHIAQPEKTLSRLDR